MGPRQGSQGESQGRKQAVVSVPAHGPIGVPIPRASHRTQPLACSPNQSPQGLSLWGSQGFQDPDQGSLSPGPVAWISFLA